jgi:threonine/homoserine/homoserine lactone efflux protein
MEIDILIRALLLGVITSMPIGPIGILCIHKTIYDGKKYGYAAAFGSVTADVIFATIAAFGISAVSNIINNHIFMIKLVAAVFLGIIGIRVYLMNPAKNEKEEKRVSKRNLIAAYFSVMILTLLNPVSILLFIALFTSFGLVNVISGNGMTSLIQIVGAVFIGSILWWFFVVKLVAKFSKNMSEEKISKISKIIGTLIFIMSVFTLVGILKKY